MKSEMLHDDDKHTAKNFGEGSRKFGVKMVRFI